MTDSKIIKPLAGVRCYFAIWILLAHIMGSYAAFMNNDFVAGFFGNSYSVIGFFMLSGFLTARKYSETFTADFIKTPKVLVLKSCSFALNHIKKWYLIYIVTLIPFLKGLSLSKIPQLICNLLIFQSVLPMPYSIAFNEVQWYLSSLAILYFFAPSILMLNKKIENKMVLNVVLLVLFIIVSSFMPYRVSIFYTMPVYRVFQFGAGIILFNLCKKIEYKFNPFMCILVLLLQLLGLFKLLTINLDVVNMLILSLFIIVFVNTDYNSFVLTNKVTMKIADASLELYLTHIIITFFVERYVFPRFNNTSLSFIIILMLILFIISIAVALFYHNVLAKWSVYKKVDGKVIGVFNKIIDKIELKCIQFQKC